MTFELRDSVTPSASEYGLEHRRPRNDEPNPEAARPPLRLVQSLGVSIPSRQIESRLSTLWHAAELAEPVYPTVIWIGGTIREETRKRTPADLRRELERLFDAEPLEDGITHAAEAVLVRAVREESDALPTIAALCRDDGYAHRTALIRCVGRLDARLVGPRGLVIMQDALRSSDVEVRDAAIVSLELLSTPEAIKALREHDEPEPWLAEYVQRVLREVG